LFARTLQAIHVALCMLYIRKFIFLDLKTKIFLLLLKSIHRLELLVTTLCLSSSYSVSYVYFWAKLILHRQAYAKYQNPRNTEKSNFKIVFIRYCRVILTPKCNSVKYVCSFCATSQQNIHIDHYKYSFTISKRIFFIISLIAKEVLVDCKLLLLPEILQ
jgi:hypothetical protein